MQVNFHFIDSRITLKDRTRLKLFIDHLFRSEKKVLDTLSVVFCSDEYLLKMNREFLQHDYYTDIITFDLSNDPKLISGELYISTDRVKENAGNLGVTVNNELHRVIFHGALHLCGYKDKTPKQVNEIRKAENKYLNLYKV